MDPQEQNQDNTNTEEGTTKNCSQTNGGNQSGAVTDISSKKQNSQNCSKPQKMDRTLDDLVHEDKINSQRSQQNSQKQRKRQNDSESHQRDERSYSPGQGKNDRRGRVQNRGDIRNQGGCKIFASNLDFSTTWGQLKDFMKFAGQVERADIFKNKDGRSRGMGIVEFTTRAGALKAVDQLHQKTLDGRKVFIKHDDALDNNNYSKGSGYQNNHDQEHRRDTEFRGGLANNDFKRDLSGQFSGGNSNSGSNYRNQNRRSRSRERNRHEEPYRNEKYDRNDSYHGRSGLQIQRREEPHPNKQWTNNFREGRQIFVGNMPFSVTENQFRQAFEEFGKILEFDLRKDDRTGSSRGQGTILFEEYEFSENAIRVMDQAKFNERVVLVQLDKNIGHSTPENQERRQQTETYDATTRGNEYSGGNFGGRALRDIRNNGRQVREVRDDRSGGRDHREPYESHHNQELSGRRQDYRNDRFNSGGNSGRRSDNLAGRNIDYRGGGGDYREQNDGRYRNGDRYRNYN